ncbi:MAG: proteasome subunit alpha [Verrucomicrobia bacterium]|nr:proteasome subunit alpha [Verrucomicrobiota bacterium]MBV8275404.1 proteasome subunit alpha [Verrucomicrobiota bacterium]
MELLESNSANAGDFVTLLRRSGALREQKHLHGHPSALGGHPPVVETQATTVLAFKFSNGVLIAGDRRATAGNVVMYDRADKVLEIDRHSVMAIAGSPATAWEMARVLEHSFQFYRRSQLQEMSVEGKVRALSKLLRDNLGMVLQGVGVVVPLFATYDHGADDPAKVFFYDAMGAQFEATDFAASGSGGPSVRSILYYENAWGKTPLRDLDQKGAITIALRALDTAAEADTATGGIDRQGKIFPVVKIVNQDGTTTVPHDVLSSLFQAALSPS